MNQALDAVAENRLLSAWWKGLSRRPDQVNLPHESDAELVPLPGTSRLLALTTDTIDEEIALGFYRDPETIGWMAATVSLSDLAAVGAEPLGLLSAVTLPPAADDAFVAGLARGLESACRAAGTFVLGGDTNRGARASVTTTGAGLVEAGRALLRRGCTPGEWIYCTGRLGAGGTCAARALLRLPDLPHADGEFRPVARVREGRTLAGFATCCMDTSDGLIATLDQLGRLNGLGLDVETPTAELLDPRALEVARAAAIPPLLFLAQPHGEFELVFTVPARDRNGFEGHARAHGFTPIVLGRTVAGTGVRIEGRAIDGARVRNLVWEAGEDVAKVLSGLVRLVAGGS